jgi:hypothetical protein
MEPMTTNFTKMAVYPTHGTLYTKYNYRQSDITKLQWINHCHKPLDNHLIWLFISPPNSPFFISWYKSSYPKRFEFSWQWRCQWWSSVLWCHVEMKVGTRISEKHTTFILTPYFNIKIDALCSSKMFIPNCKSTQHQGQKTTTEKSHTESNELIFSYSVLKTIIQSLCTEPWVYRHLGTNCYSDREFHTALTIYSSPTAMQRVSK